MSRRKWRNQRRFDSTGSRDERYENGNITPARSRPRAMNETSRQQMPKTSSSGASTCYKTYYNCHLPGFYYDEVKKTYNRVFPDNYGTNEYSESRVLAKLAEKRETETLSNHNTLKRPVLQLTREREIGLCTVNIFKQSMEEYRLKGLREVLRQPVLKGSVSNDAEMEIHGCLKMTSYPGISSILGVWPFDSNYYPKANRATLIKVNPKKSCPNEKKNSEYTLELTASDNFFLMFNTTVQDFCWANVSNDMHSALYTYYDVAGNHPSGAHLYPLKDYCTLNTNTDIASLPKHHFILGKGVVWSCAWSKSSSVAGFGWEKEVVLRNLHSSVGTRVSTKQQQAVCLAFSQSGQCLFTGTHRGEIQCSDLRSSSNQLQLSIPVGQRVTGLQILQLEDRILCSSSENKLCMLDLRNKKAIVTYQGHKSDHKKASVCVQEGCDIVCAVGSDHCTRIWRLSTGELVKLIKPPCKIESHDYLPSAWLSNEWGNHRSEFGLILAVKGEIFLYQ